MKVTWVEDSANVKLDRHRVFVRAARAWRAGYPHQAWEIIAKAGLGRHWLTFEAAVLAQARHRYRAAIERYYV